MSDAGREPLEPHRIGVLVVEDEALLRIDMVDRLEAAGLATFEAGSAEAAFALLEARSDVRVMITDVDFIAGALSGFDLARMVARRWPAIGILITSGRARPTLGDLPGSARFLPKPCNTHELVSAVFGFLEAGRETP